MDCALAGAHLATGLSRCFVPAWRAMQHPVESVLDYRKRVGWGRQAGSDMQVRESSKLTGPHELAQASSQRMVQIVIPFNQYPSMLLRKRGECESLLRVEAAAPF